MPPITIYTTQFCPFCVQAKMLLNQKGLTFNEIKVDGNPSLRAKMAKAAGRTSVPQIWVGEHHVGGCDDLYALERKGKLDALISDYSANA